jgi:AcrR family transcriptional regulator
MKKREEVSTRARILAAAERLFSHQGLEQATIRGIAAEAGVNIAAVNYHFGSKEALERETFRMLAERVNRDRLLRLQRCLEAAGARPPRLEDLVTALVAPYLERDASKPGLLPQLILLLSLPGASDKSKRAVATAFDEVAARFVDAFGLALPRLSKAELWWRYNLAIGAIVYTVGNSGTGTRLKRLSGGAADPARRGELLDHLVAFVCAGLRGQTPASILATGSILALPSGGARQARGGTK